MQIVINISVDTFCDLKKKQNRTEVDNAVLNGIPLHKGHGPLIDANEIEWYGCTTAFDCPHKDRACKDCPDGECSKTQVDDIQPIIEAESEEQE